MVSCTDVNASLIAEIERVGGGYLKVETNGDAADCSLFVHEGSELGVSPPGTVYWHRWDDAGLSKQDLLSLLRTWPTFARRKLDPRVGIWYAVYRRQRHRTTGAVRWKALGKRDVYYPNLFRWDDLERLGD
jgi:hypothetical protein